MSDAALKLPDKTIVDRRKTTRNSDLRRTVIKTRERLNDFSSVDPKFNRQMLIQHVKAASSSLGALPVLIMVTTLLGLATGFGLELVIWAIIANLLYLCLILFARQLGKRAGDKTINLQKWSLVLLMAHVIAGLGWVALIFVPCDACSSTDGMLFKAMVVLIAMASTVTLCFTLRWSVLAAFAAPVLCFIGYGIAVGVTHLYMISATLALALAFFTALSARLNRTAHETADIQSRNDALIAELEMARSISEEARRRAEEANMAKSRFLASMSHELRTPLNAILGFSEMMVNEVLGKLENRQYKDYVRDIHSSGTHLLNLINEILDLSRIEAGKYDMKNDALRLDDIALDCMSLMRLRSEQKAIALERNFEQNLPQMLGDERAIRQIILNLLSNAVKFTPHNGVITMTIGWTASGGQYVSVSDTGPGIPADEIPVVLSAFGQGSIAIKSAEQGTGLGLPIVQALVALHDGKFVLESELRKGTRATAFFPPKRTLESLPANAQGDESRVKSKTAATTTKLRQTA